MEDYDQNVHRMGNKSENVNDEFNIACALIAYFASVFQNSNNDKMVKITLIYVRPPRIWSRIWMFGSLIFLIVYHIARFFGLLRI